MWLKGRTLSSGERLTVQFYDVDGMRPGSMVQLMGHKVGQVETVIPVVKAEKSYVDVSFVITDKNIEIPKGSIISIQQSGLIGEKLIEITPPPIQTARIYIKETPEKIPTNIPVVLSYDGKLHEVGELLSYTVKSDIDENLVQTKEGFDITKEIRHFYEINYIITRAGLEIPDIFDFKLSEGSKAIVVTPPEKFLVNIPPQSLKFTTEDPLRVKKFMELQVSSAEALKATNDKINELLQPEQIETLKDTLNNTKVLTGRLIAVLDEANMLIGSSRRDLRKLVNSSTKLSDNIVTISDNVNDIIGDEQLKKDLLATVSAVKTSTGELSNILSDPSLKETIDVTKETTKNFSEIVSYVKDLKDDEELKSKFTTTINNLNCSLVRLSQLLERVDNITESQEEDIEEIIDESADTAENLSKFSEKLNKRFLLFRLLF